MPFLGGKKVFLAKERQGTKKENKKHKNKHT